MLCRSRVILEQMRSLYERHCSNVNSLSPSLHSNIPS
ncbi:hypothetical protein OIU77_019446 [Salix suchowensis]|uniref:Uncharacterized protein n=1 Tax=Salix suchowensis TaxID=1278906 RepID=A0ABQ9CJE4_9ROSI|nr:hypothetical protein OIU77_019446 [Salix suchowensis]KAJ6398667.1 hypothetical protein OIU77_019446 [Salix suchowensis]KAJ6398668.1 hypothetical protein OIU77_019446 [Salix suchowensis]